MGITVQEVYTHHKVFMIWTIHAHFLPGFLFPTQPILAEDWHFPAQRHQGSIQVEVLNLLTHR